MWHRLAQSGACGNGIMRMLTQGKGPSLRQCAWLLQLAALQLHRADLAVLAHREDCKRLLTALFDAAPADPTTGKASPALSLPLCAVAF